MMMALLVLLKASSETSGVKTWCSGGSATWKVFYALLLTIQICAVHVEAGEVQYAEICDWDAFSPNCSVNEVVFIDSALYGRIRSGKCASLDSQERPCIINVMGYIDKQCGGRRSCEVRLPSQPLESMVPSSCQKDRSRYLNVSYHCQEVYTADEQSCVNNQSLTVSNSVGFLANIITDTTNKGLPQCPWKLQLQPHQTVTLTLFDFHVYLNSSVQEKNSICVIYAMIKESTASLDGQKNLVCQGETRVRPLLTSMASEVQIAVTPLNTGTGEHIYFLVKYEVFGCPPFVPPDDTYVENISTGYRVVCQHPGGGSWEVQCNAGKWISSRNINCTNRLSSTGSQDVASDALSINQGILIGIVIAVAILISTIIVVVGICLLQRRKSFSPGDGLLDSPVFDKHGNILYHTPMMGKRCATPDALDRTVADLQRDYATTLQMRQMVLPSAVIQPEFIPFTESDIWMCPVHGPRPAAIAVSNGSLNRRNLGCLRPRMQHFYELPATPEVEVPGNPQQQSGEPPSPVSPFYHELDPNLSGLFRVASQAPPNPSSLPSTSRENAST